MAPPDLLMHKFPLVSIITPSFNQGQFLEKTIQAVLEQDYPNIEYIVIDGGSTDQSVDIIQRYADRLKYWVSEPDQGQSHAINKGLARATGEFLGWLNSDDVLFSDSIRKSIEVFQQNKAIDVVYGRLVRIDAMGKMIPTPTLPKDKITFGPKNLLLECSVNQPGSLWRKSILEKVGLLNENLHFGLDYEYWIRILLAGGNFLRRNDPVAAFRLSDNSKTVGQTAKMAIESIQIIDHFASLDDTSQKLGLSKNQLRAQARRGKSIMSLYVFYGYFKEKKCGKAIKWFVRAHIYNPMILLTSRWLSLFYARIKR